MTTISQIKDWPLGTPGGGGFLVTAKTAKKIWQVNGVWYQQACIMDATGEMLADFKLGKLRNPLHSGGEYRVIVCQVQAEEKQGKKLFVDQFEALTQTADEYDRDVHIAMDNREREIRSKIKCWLVSGCLQSGKNWKDIDEWGIDQLVEFIMK